MQVGSDLSGGLGARNGECFLVKMSVICAEAKAEVPCGDPGLGTKNDEWKVMLRPGRDQDWMTLQILNVDQFSIFYVGIEFDNKATAGQSKNRRPPYSSHISRNPYPICRRSRQCTEEYYGDEWA